MPALSLTDMYIVMRSTLMANTTIRDLCKGRVYTGHVRRKEQQDALEKGPAIFMTVSAEGDTDYQGSFSQIRVILFVASMSTEAVCTALSDAVGASLHAECLSADGVDSRLLCRPFGIPDPGFDQVIDSHYVRTAWTVSVIH